MKPAVTALVQMDFACLKQRLRRIRTELVPADGPTLKQIMRAQQAMNRITIRTAEQAGERCCLSPVKV